MIEVFKTDIKNNEQAAMVRGLLTVHFRYTAVSFDLEDCDNILRIEASNVEANLIIEALSDLKIDCHVLEG